MICVFLKLIEFIFYRVDYEIYVDINCMGRKNVKFSTLYLTSDNFDAIITLKISLI